jgi:hypothetical protein
MKEGQGEADSLLERGVGNRLAERCRASGLVGAESEPA